MPLSVAVVGAGPSGFYATEAMLKAFPDCSIDIIEKYPAPFGLVRYGVAPDHLSTKNVTKLYEKTLDKARVRFLGNVELGRDVSYPELKTLFDVVILAFGMGSPRKLKVSGEDLNGVVSVTDFVGWYNAVPDTPSLLSLVSSARSAVILGNGNVALDVARLLAKTEAEFIETDIVPEAARGILSAPLKDIYVVGRRGPLEANFSFPELSEFGNLCDAEIVVDPKHLPLDASRAAIEMKKKKERNLRILRSFSDNVSQSKSVRLHLIFYASPVEIMGRERINCVKMVRNKIIDGKAVATGDCFDLNADLLIPAIGYRATPIEHVPLSVSKDSIKNQDGRVEKGVYVVGWARRGPTGVIGTNRVDSREVVSLIMKDAPSGLHSGSSALDSLLSQRNVRVINLLDWRKIDEAEMAGVSGGRPRIKFTTSDAMLKAVSS